MILVLELFELTDECEKCIHHDEILIDQRVLLTYERKPLCMTCMQPRPYSYSYRDRNAFKAVPDLANRFFLKNQTRSRRSPWLCQRTA